MKITFVSNYINHHQIPMADELYRLSGGEYTFIQTEPMEEERVEMGWDADSVKKPYVKVFSKAPEECRKLIMESDTVIFGGTDDESYIMPRLEAGLFTVRYSERIYKTGRWKFISPRGLKKKYHDHVRFKKDPVYLLCAGAYVKGDFKLIGAYKNKMFKFGYFPKFEAYEDLDEKRKNNKYINILWVGRFIDLKHPEMVVKLKEALKDCGELYSITMVGSGKLLDRMIQEAGNEIKFTGPKKPQEVRELMREADIFVTTSDRNEGWGAVINEALNAGCAVVASDKMGAAPYLIRDGVNGFKFKSGKQKDLNEKVLKLIKDGELRHRLGKEAYETIKTEWNANEAAARLFEFMESRGKNPDKYREGPMSRA